LPDLNSYESIFYYPYNAYQYSIVSFYAEEWLTLFTVFFEICLSYKLGTPFLSIPYTFDFLDTFFNFLESENLLLSSSPHYSEKNYLRRLRFATMLPNFLYDKDLSAFGDRYYNLSASLGFLPMTKGERMT